MYATDNHGWSELLSPRIPHPALTQSGAYDWVVIGAGVTGLAAARRLAEQYNDAQILLLDAREIGQGATARSSGFAVDSSRFGGPVSAMDIKDCQRVNAINRTGLGMLRDLVKTYDLDCDWREDGLFHLAADQTALKELPDYIGYLEKMGLPHDVLSTTELSDHLGTSHYQGGVRIHDGALVQPGKLVRELARCLPANVTLAENSPVLDIVKGAPHQLTLPYAKITAKYVILASNYEIAKLGFLKSRITGIVLSGSFTRPLDDHNMQKMGDLQTWGGMSLHETGATLRLTVDRRISIRNVAEFKQARLLSPSELAERTKIHRHSFEARFPQLAHIPFDYSWSGVEGISRNTTNFFGPIGDNLWFAGGYNGSGISRGTTFGTAIAEMAMGQKTERVDHCLKSKKAQWMPPEPLRSFTANMVLKTHHADVGKDG